MSAPAGSTAGSTGGSTGGSTTGSASGSASGSGATRQRTGRLGSVLRVLFACLLLGAVAYFVPWRDRLVWRSGDQAWNASGTIHGDWSAERIAFEIDPAESLAPEWPASARTAQQASTPLDLTRAEAASPEPHFEWRPGMLRVFRELDPKGLFVAMGMILFSALVATARWHRLLRIAGCPTSFGNAFRLTFVGFFFNLIVPGLTGGDLIKGLLVVRENVTRRTDAAMSVIVDRALGLLVLMGLASCITLMPNTLFSGLRIPILLTFGGVVLALWLGLHPLPRRWLKIEALIERLPKKERIQKLDRAVRLYGGHPFELFLAVLLSIVNHASLAYGLYELGRAFGDTKLNYFEYLGVASVANTISSVPIAPGGWGVGEAAYASMFHLLGGATTLGIAVSVTYRLLTMGMSLLGGVFLLLPGGESVRETRAEIEAGHGVVE